ncbi:MAG: hypothetical protein QF749_13100, partial [Verrucomicrobiota bacterium]|nr:hypothetical protein [Verrucomicrobiota bacterium]
ASTSRHENLMGCRQLYPETFGKVMEEVAARRCVSCHEKGVPLESYMRITRVENNSFLLAPLAKESGGTQLCGKPVFKSKSDPDYQSIMKTFDSMTRLIRTKPRIDMDEVQIAGCDQQ